MRFRKVTTEIVEPDMTPMVDIIFQLLTFFMITMSFENSKADERVKLPRDAIARPTTVKPEHELVLNLVYRRDSTGALTKSIPEVFYDNRYVDINRISPQLDQERRIMDQLYGGEVLKDVTVVIRADSQVPTGMVQDLVKRCQDAGFSRFSLKAAAEEI